MHKLCTRCNISKLVEEFHKHKTSNDGYRTICKNCRLPDTRTYATERRKTHKVEDNSKRAEWKRKQYQTSKGKFQACKDSAKRRSIEFLLTLEEYNLLICCKHCHYCDELLVTPSIDRVDNNQGYLITNVVACCAPCNYMKLTHSVTEFSERIIKLYNNLANWSKV